MKTNIRQKPVLQIFQKLSQLLFDLHHRICFSPSDKYFFWSNPQSKTYFSDTPFCFKIIDFQIFIRNKTVTKFQKLKLISTHVNLRKHVPPISLFAGLISSKNVSFGNPTFSEEVSIAKTIILILASASWWFWLISVFSTIFSLSYRSDLYHWDSKQKIYFRIVVIKEKVKTFVPVIKIHTLPKSESAIIIDFFRHSNSFFSVTTGLISAIRVSSENLVLLVEFWNELLTNLILTSVAC